MKFFDFLKEPNAEGTMLWSFRRVTGLAAVVAAIVAGFLGKTELMAGAFAYAGSCGVSLGISEIGKR